MTIQRYRERFLSKSNGVMTAAFVNFFISIAGMVAVYFLVKHTVIAWETGLFAAVAVYIVTEKIQAFSSAYAERNLHSEITELTERSVNVTYIGTHREGLFYCSGKMKGALRFQDTYFRTKADELNRSHSKTTDLYYEAIADMVIQGGSFDCLVSKHNENVFKETIKPILSEVKKRGGAARFQVRSLDHTAALIGIQILTYTANDAEVVFGWNFSEKDVGRVFASRDPKLIRYFSDLYATLERDGKDIEFSALISEPASQKQV